MSAPRECSVQGGFFFARGKWASLFCQQCSSSSTARKWLCACGSVWTSCPLHANMGFHCKRCKRKPVSNTIGPHRKEYAPSKKVCIYRDRLCLEGLPSDLSDISKRTSSFRSIQKSQMRTVSDSITGRASNFGNASSSSDACASSSGAMPVQLVGTEQGTSGKKLPGQRGKRNCAEPLGRQARKKGKLRHQADHLALGAIHRMRAARSNPF